MEASVDVLINKRTTKPELKGTDWRREASEVGQTLWPALESEREALEMIPPSPVVVDPDQAPATVCS